PQPRAKSVGIRKTVATRPGDRRGRQFSIVCMQTDLPDPQIPTSLHNFLSLRLLSECVRFAILGGGGGRSSPSLLALSPWRPSTRNFSAASRFFHKSGRLRVGPAGSGRT